MRRSKASIAAVRLQQLAARLLRNAPVEGDVPVIVSEPPEAVRSASKVSLLAVGHLQERRGGCVKAIMDRPVALERAVMVFLPGNAYLAEAVSCVTEHGKYAVELTLIQNRS